MTSFRWVCNNWLPERNQAVSPKIYVSHICHAPLGKRAYALRESPNDWLRISSIGI